MKIFTYALLIIALGLIIFNCTLLDFNNLTEQDSLVALIGITSAICAIIILLIFKTSKLIEKKLKQK